MRFLSVTQAVAITIIAEGSQDAAVYNAVDVAVLFSGCQAEPNHSLP